MGNLGGVEAEARPWHGRPYSAVLQLPPAGVLWLVPDPAAETEPALAPEIELETD